MSTKIYIETAGCSANQADSEQMAGLLQKAKFEIVNCLEEAFVLIFNTCTVKGPTERKFFLRLEEIKSKFQNKIIIIAGCIPQTDPEKLAGYPLVGPKQIHHIVEIVEEALNGNNIQALTKKEIPPLNLPRIRKNKLIGVVQISRGCLGTCTYCKTKAARGNLISYPIEEIKNETENLIKDGAKEIWLTSQDNGCYGFDIKTNLAKLLEEIVKLPYGFQIRIGMINPNNLLKFKDEFIKVFEHRKIFKFIHLPVQSGSNEILKKMGREYTVEDFVGLVNELRINYRELTLATDIIVGFPSETEDQFDQTVKLIRTVMPEAVNISKFWPRQKTIADKMERLSGEVVKHRSVFIKKIRENISRIRNERWLGWKGKIIIDEKGTELNQWAGRNYAYKKIVVEGDYRIGEILEVKINRVSTYCLLGSATEQS